MVTAYQCREDDLEDARDMVPKHLVSSFWVVVASAAAAAPSRAGMAAGLVASGPFTAAAAWSPEQARR